jgi:hypothetical protein
MTGSASSQNLTVSGAGFVAGGGLEVAVGTVTYQGSAVDFVSSSQLVVSVNVGVSAQNLSVKVTIPGGKASNSPTLTVTAPSVAPVIAILGPNPMIGSNSAQTLTIIGSGFQAGLKLLIGGTSITASELAMLTPTELQVSIVTGLSTHTYAVQVVNSNGGTSNAVNFQVNAPPVPAITSLTPDPLTGATAAQVLTINGTNFQSGSGLKVTVGGTLYTGSQVTFVSGSQVKATVTVPAGSKTLAVQVTNPSGEASNSEALTVK